MPPSRLLRARRAVRRERRLVAGDERVRRQHRLLRQHLLGALRSARRAWPAARRGSARSCSPAMRAGAAPAGAAPAASAEAARRNRRPAVAPRRSRAGLVGVPAAVSAGGAGGLPDLPREARGFGVVSDSVFGGRAMRRIWRAPPCRSSRLHRPWGDQLARSEPLAHASLAGTRLDVLDQARIGPHRLEFVRRNGQRAPADPCRVRQPWNGDRETFGAGVGPD